ncbi:MAG: hypothetical protein PHU71_07055, partial [Candidatus Gracilibacteria bacterium]|nr:hypothetical protein [Candidatus Gracilibacteria bacterium]
MAKTHANLLSDFKYVVRNTDVSSTDFDFHMNNTLPTFIRKLARFNLHNHHIQYIPKLKIDLTADTWEYSWLDETKYSNTDLDFTSGVTEALTGVKTTYFIAPGDLCTYNSIDYNILAVTGTTFTIDSSLTDTAHAGYVYARPLIFTDCYLLETGGTAGIDEIPV